MELGSRNLKRNYEIILYTFTDIRIPSQIIRIPSQIIRIPSQIIKLDSESEQISVKLPSRRLNKNQINVGNGITIEIMWYHRIVDSALVHTQPIFPHLIVWRFPLIHPMDFPQQR